jgi:hypothetical protein
MKPAKIHYYGQSSPQLHSVINNMSGVYILLQYISKIHFNIILQRHLFHSLFLTNNFYIFPITFIHAAVIPIFLSLFYH